VSPVSRPQAELTAHQNVLAENVALRAEVAAFKVNAAKKSAKSAKAAEKPGKIVRSVARRRSEG
jgi:hypothetical protein